MTTNIDMVWESKPQKMVASTKALGLKISAREMDMKCINLETITKESSFKINLMAKELISGQMERCLKVSGANQGNRALVSGKALRVTAMLASGKRIYKRDMEFIPGPMETSMKVSGDKVLRTVKEQIYLLTKIATQEHTLMDYLMEKELTSGKVAPGTKEVLLKA
jgi:hypothetical protein